MKQSPVILQLPGFHRLAARRELVRSWAHQRTCRRNKLLVYEANRPMCFRWGPSCAKFSRARPPYVAESPAEVFDKSAQADQREAHIRLDDCQADPELIDLAKQCLRPNRKDRPADAGEVADRFSNYLQTVQTRLKEAEIASARSAAVALEEKKRRRMTLALMATALAFVMAGFGGWSWLEKQRWQQGRKQTARQARIVQQLNQGRRKRCGCSRQQPVHHWMTLPYGHKLALRSGVRSRSWL